MKKIVPNEGLILLISGPAGSGKTTLCDRILEEFDQVKRIVTATTRQPREGEINGEHYHFFSDKEFEEKLDEDAFYESALVHGRHYGTLKSEVHGKVESGFDVILNIDVQGAASFRKRALNDSFLQEKLVTVFIQPSSIEVIRARLRFRESDTDEEIERRLISAKMELRQAPEYDYILPTSTKEKDFQLISGIYLAEKHRVK